ncbi:aryl-alcohol dehydrogenase-like predicted oxidoreductase [Rhizobium sp. 57MFTsu3.2]|nr:aldo/keto reductase [Rhizobium sp. 57MFTsu3.2]NMN73138.1 aryl-alcohol dehydrogenase-like predicted oxidoreductase [Rhizobium sp. 57MFTsu3.2]
MGNTDLNASVLGLGTSRLTSISTGLSRHKAIELVAVAADHGINFIDTADIYGQGDSEAVIGQAIKGVRGRFIVATKVGYRFSEKTGLLVKAMPLLKRALRPFKGARRLAANMRNNAHHANIITQDFSPSYLVAAIDSSLRRLATDYIDILYLHDVPADFETSESLFNALSTIQRSGKVRYFGISAEHDDALTSVCSNPLLLLVQTDLHPSRGRTTFASIEQAGKAIVVNKVFSGGHEDAISAFAQRHGVTIRQALLGYALKQPFVASVLTGTTNRNHLIENVSSVKAAKLLPFEELAS